MINNWMFVSTGNLHSFFVCSRLIIYISMKRREKSVCNYQFIKDDKIGRSIIIPAWIRINFCSGHFFIVYLRLPKSEANIEKLVESFIGANTPLLSFTNQKRKNWIYVNNRLWNRLLNYQPMKYPPTSWLWFRIVLTISGIGRIVWFPL